MTVAAGDERRMSEDVPRRTLQGLLYPEHHHLLIVLEDGAPSHRSSEQIAHPENISLIIMLPPYCALSSTRPAAERWFLEFRREYCPTGRWRR